MRIAQPHRNTLACGIALALLLPATGRAQSLPAEPAAPTTGQDAPAAQPQASDNAAQLDTVVVTGVRASLARSVELKRAAGTVQDSITALELGKFPDDNVADSLSHITGV